MHPESRNSTIPFPVQKSDSSVFQGKLQQSLKMQEQVDQAPLSKQIEVAKEKAKLLYDEIINVKRHTQDTNLQRVSANVLTIPRDSWKLRLYNTLRGHQNKVAKLCWNAESTKILSASQDGYMIIWDAITGFKKQAIQLDNTWVLTCSMSPNENLVASAGLDNNCTIYKIKSDTSNNPVQMRQQQQFRSNIFPLQTGFSQSVQSIFKSHTAYISECEFIGNNSIVTASGDMTCMLWDITKGFKSRDFIDHVGDVLCLTVFPPNILSDNLFISGSSDGYAKVWDLRSQTPTQSFSISNSDVNCVRVFPDGNTFAVGSDDGQIRLIDLRSDCEVAHYSLISEIRNMQGLNETGMGSQLLSPATPFERKTYSLGNSYTMLTPSSAPINATLASSDGLSISSRNSTLENSGVFSLDFGKSGRLLYSCYSDYGCVVWDTLKNEIIGTLGNEHLNKINKVAVSPDGVALATGSWDATVKVWSV
ncbi:STE4 [Candida margitis]|uniref:STE4 n=1 Tax=Candida margitis TaxID=1775924 RepID=UPI002225CED1|nr:STE4 [Candida margitis]KAI5954073.1 STE4 [Candida margitis]